MSRVEVFQPRDPEQFYDQKRQRVIDDRFYRLRDVSRGLVDPEDLDWESFVRWYDLVGGEEIEADDPETVCRVIWDTWSTRPSLVDRSTSETFLELHEEGRVDSLACGHVVRVDGTAYLYGRYGCDEIPAVSL